MLNMEVTVVKAGNNNCVIFDAKNLILMLIIAKNQTIVIETGKTKDKTTKALQSS